MPTSMCARTLLPAKRHTSWIAYCNGIKAAVSRQEYNCTNICKVITASDYLQDACASFALGGQNPVFVVALEADQFQVGRSPIHQPLDDLATVRPAIDIVAEGNDCRRSIRSVARWRCQFWADCTPDISERKFPTGTGLQHQYFRA